ncbi:hypothetical protein [Luteolibacter sp. LG18]|uniref:hypothetical protein n=1 Tax=Luteolibacter sp. LG18 TaxID=2819286 RepID=UPI002B2B4E74|nr:hypothetical protein llg_08530 [Luteolibacter sp. LG18]
MRSKRWMAGIVVVGLVAIAILLVAPLFVTRCSGCGSYTQAMSNARQIGLALFDFDSDYSSFPNPDTAIIVRDATHTTLDLSDGTSNGVFRQLIAAGIVSSEEIFYTKCHGSVKPDNRLGAGALARGECGFAYIVSKPNTVTGPSNPPLVVAPLIPGTLKFDPVPFDGKAVILRIDNTAMNGTIQPDGTVRDGGKDIFDPSQPYWNGTPPEVKWADLPVPPLPSAPPDDPIERVMLAIICLVFSGLGVVFVWKRWLRNRDGGRTEVPSRSPVKPL